MSQMNSISQYHFNCFQKLVLIFSMLFRTLFNPNLLIAQRINVVISELVLGPFNSQKTIILLTLYYYLYNPRRCRKSPSKSIKRCLLPEVTLILRKKNDSNFNKKC